MISSLLLTAGLSIDRLLSIKQPKIYTFRLTLNTCIWACVCIWFMSALYNILVHALFTFYPMGGLFDVRVYSSFFSCLFASWSIVVCAKEHIRRENAAQRRFGPKRDQMTLDTFRFSIIITTASGLLFLLYLPSQLFALFTFIDPNRKLRATLIFQDVAYPPLLLESLLGPLVYLLRFSETRQMIRRLFCFATEDAPASRNTTSTISAQV